MKSRKPVFAPLVVVMVCLILGVSYFRFLQEEQRIESEVEAKGIQFLAIHQRALDELKTLRKYDYMSQVANSVRKHEQVLTGPGADPKSACRDLLFDLQQFASLTYGRHHLDEPGDIWGRTQDLIEEFQQAESA